MQVGGENEGTTCVTAAAEVGGRVAGAFPRSQDGVGIRPGDGPARRLLSVLPKDRGEPGCGRHARAFSRSVSPLLGIHAHVQGPSEEKEKPRRPLVQLEGGNPQIGQQEVHALKRPRRCL